MDFFSIPKTIQELTFSGDLKKKKEGKKHREFRVSGLTVPVTRFLRFDSFLYG